jgi:hypothetical protein
VHTTELYFWTELIDAVSETRKNFAVNNKTEKKLCTKTENSASVLQELQHFKKNYAVNPTTQQYF